MAQFLFRRSSVVALLGFDTISFSKIQCCGSARVGAQNARSGRASLRRVLVLELIENASKPKAEECVARLRNSKYDHSDYLRKKLSALDLEVYARHSCKTKYLAHVNTLLTDVQKTFIQTTPFAWLLSIDTNIKMSRNLVLQLCSRWLERRGGFEVRVKDNLHRQSSADIVAENEALCTITVEQEVSIAKLEKVIVLYGVGKSNSEKDFDMDGDDVGKSNSEDSDIFGDVVDKIDFEKSGDVLVDEVMDIQKSDMYTCLKAQPRKRVKSVCLKTPWTRLDRKNHRPIE
ncbi:hypothetical protein V8G54_006739 [Vigna mungo]|uniref:Uncharacterized protein n=1 Tax=Vigna mungo TaxID=3915 RepID=A0AAQ3P2Q4_VIGMU